MKKKILLLCAFMVLVATFPSLANNLSPVLAAGNFDVTILSADIGYNKHSRKYVKETLEYTRGVVKAHIDRYDNSIIVIYDKNMVDEKQLVDRVNGAGSYFAARVVSGRNIQVVILPANLDNKHARKHIKNSLEYTRGVLYAHPERYQHAVFAVYDRDVVNEKQLAEVVNGVGGSRYFDTPARYNRR